MIGLHLLMKKCYCNGGFVVSSKSLITNSVLVDYCIPHFDLLFWSTHMLFFWVLFNFHTKLTLHWLLHVLSVLNKVLCVDCWVLLFWVSSWFIVVCSKLVFDEMLYALFLCCCLIYCCMFSRVNDPPHCCCHVFVMFLLVL